MIEFSISAFTTAVLDCPAPPDGILQQKKQMPVGAVWFRWGSFNRIRFRRVDGDYIQELPQTRSHSLFSLTLDQISARYCQSLLAFLPRDELLNHEIFYTLEEARILIEIWRKGYNQVRPHSSLGYKPPAPEAIQTVSLSTPLFGPLSVGLT